MDPVVSDSLCPSLSLSLSLSLFLSLCLASVCDTCHRPRSLRVLACLCLMTRFCPFVRSVCPLLSCHLVSCLSARLRMPVCQVPVCQSESVRDSQTDSVGVCRLSVCACLRLSGSETLESLCLSLSLSLSDSVYLSICLSARLPVCLSAFCLSVCLSVCPSSVCQVLFLSACIFFALHTRWSWACSPSCC